MISQSCNGTALTLKSETAEGLHPEKKKFFLKSVKALTEAVGGVQVLRQVLPALSALCDDASVGLKALIIETFCEAGRLYGSRADVAAKVHAQLDRLFNGSPHEVGSKRVLKGVSRVLEVGFLGCCSQSACTAGLCLQSILPEALTR